MLSLLKLRHRVLIWGLLQLLPEPKLQGPNLRLIFLGMVAAVMGSILLIAAITLGLFGLHYYLLDKGIEPYMSLFIMGGGFLFTAICSGIALYFCFRKKNHAVEIPKPIDSLGDIGEAIGKTVGNLKILKAPFYFNEVVDGFMEGLSNDGTQKPKSKKMMDTIEELFDAPLGTKKSSDHPLH